MTDSFGRLLRAEWTKFRSVRRWVIGMTVAAGLSILLSALFASVGNTDANSAPSFTDQFHFVHQQLTGDGSLIARVASQEDSHPWAKAGLMIKEHPIEGSPYASILVTPRNGVRMQSNFATDLAGSGRAAPLWLKLSRSGTTIIGSESADGTTWAEVGTVTLAALPEKVEIGLFVNSPGVFFVERQFGSTTTGDRPTLGKAAFDNVTVTGSTDGAESGWRDEDIGEPLFQDNVTGLVQSGGTFTVTGSGDIVRIPQGDDDMVYNTLSGVTLGLMIMAVVAVLFVTSEYKRGTIRTTFMASPRRGRVLVAKAVVIGAVTFIAGLVASAGAFTVANRVAAGRGYSPPAYPHLSLADGPVLRAVVGSALLLGLMAVFSLALGAIFRRSAGAITLVIMLMVVPQIVLTAVPLTVALWVGRVTPIAGLAIQQTRVRWDTAIAPWSGLAVFAGYAVATLAVAIWQIRRRDA
jgi:ABC-type transport system involved in multi-copper enzyme maturation permease subunit